MSIGLDALHTNCCARGFTEPRAVAFATAVTEIARNIIVNAGRGMMSFSSITDEKGRRIVAVARDDGPGIPDIARAMQDGYSTAGSLGLGLSGARGLVDEFAIESVAGKGVTVTLTQWAVDVRREPSRGNPQTTSRPWPQGKTAAKSRSVGIPRLARY